MKLTPTQVLERFDVKKTTLYRHKDTGKVTWEKDAMGQSVLDVAEAERFYKSKSHNGTSQIDPPEQVGTTEVSHEIEMFRREIKFLEEKVGERDDQITKLDTETVWLRGQVDKQTDQVKLITDERDEKARAVQAKATELEETTTQLEEKDRQLAAKDKEIVEAYKPLTFWERLTGRRQNFSLVSG